MFEGLAKYRFKKMKKTLLNGKFELIRLEMGGVSLIALPNGNLVFGEESSVILLDEYFKEIKKVYVSRLECCALNHRNEIYVSCGYEKCIILFDSNLNKIKKFPSEASHGLCCQDDYLYICDRDNERIQILNLDFQFASTIQMDIRPKRVQTSETTIGVFNDDKAYFYNLKTRALKYKYDYYQHIINYIDSIFCASSFGRLFFFDSDGNFIEEMVVNENVKKYLHYHTSGFLCRYKDNIYMTDRNSHEILKFIE